MSDAPVLVPPSNANSSATGGYLVPSSPPPLDDDGLQDLLTSVVAGVTGIPDTLVRPRWQRQSPPQPSRDTNWAAVGVTSHAPMDYPYRYHDGSVVDPTDSKVYGVTTMTSWERLAVLVSFYGPNAAFYAGLLKGLYLPQNRDALYAQGVKLTAVDDSTTVPDLVNTEWLNRVDVPIRLVRQVDRVYAIRNLIAAQITFAWDYGVQSFTVLPGGIGAITIGATSTGSNQIIGG